MCCDHPNESLQVGARIGDVELGHLLEEGARALVEMNEHPAAPGIEPQFSQVPVAAAKLLRVFHSGRPDQLTGQIVGPQVVGTLKGARVSAALRELGQPMRTHVRESPKLAVQAMRDEDRVAGALDAEIVARQCQVFLSRHRKPVPQQDALAFHGIVFWIREVRDRDRIGGEGFVRHGGLRSQFRGVRR